MSVSNLHVLPDDLFEDIILPDLLSQHLHSLLVDPDSPSWNAFCVLPLVSPLFQKSCQRIVSKMFGTKMRPDKSTGSDADDSDDDDGELHPSELLEYAMTVCRRARSPASKVTLHDHNLSTLMEHRSLIRVYICLALGKMFLNVDVLLPLGVSGGKSTRAPRSPWDEDYEDVGGVLHEPGAFDEANMHRCFMPFDCAQRICDFVVPERLGFIAAQYMAEVLPLYQSLPIFAKYALDLRFNVARKYKLELVGPLSSEEDLLDSPTGQDDYAAWALQTLGRLEVAEEFIDSLMSPGVLVHSFHNNQEIPPEALKMTDILGALDDVVRAEWGSKPATDLIRKRAAALIMRWSA